MSQEWLNIQSFFTDHELLGAINDLSIAIKQEAAGVQDAERERRAKQRGSLLKRFLGRLGEVESAGSKELLLGVDCAIPESDGRDCVGPAGRKPLPLRAYARRGR